jgi:hypothetical protein
VSDLAGVETSIPVNPKQEHVNAAGTLRRGLPKKNGEGRIGNVAPTKRKSQVQNITNDPITAEFRTLGVIPPAVAVIEAARQFADDATLARLVRRLASERKLRAYATGNNFAQLAKLFRQAESITVGTR